MKRLSKPRREAVQSLTTRQLARAIGGAVQASGATTMLYAGSGSEADNPLFG